jgi:hypothetical protein
MKDKYLQHIEARFDNRPLTDLFGNLGIPKEETFETIWDKYLSDFFDDDAPNIDYRADLHFKNGDMTVIYSEHDSSVDIFSVHNSIRGQSDYGGKNEFWVRKEKGELVIWSEEQLAAYKRGERGTGTAPKGEMNNSHTKDPKEV